MRKLVTIGNSKFDLELAILSDLSENIIIGKPFLVQEKCLLDFSNSCLILGNLGRESISFVRYGNKITNTSTSILINHVNQDFPENLEKQFQQILDKYAKVFDNSIPLKQTNAMEHDIKLKSDKIINLKQYKVSDIKKNLIRTQVRDMLENNVIEKSTSPYSSPVLIVPREGKEPQFCVDFQKLNDITVDEECQPLDIRELINSLGDNAVFST